MGLPMAADIVEAKQGVILLTPGTVFRPGVTPKITRFDGTFASTVHLPGDGLRLYNTIIDQAGFLWAATNRGLFRYDGKNFLQFVNQHLGDENNNNLNQALSTRCPDTTVQHAGLLSNLVLDIFQAADGLFYVSTQNGISSFDLKKNQWNHVSKPDEASPACPSHSQNR